MNCHDAEPYLDLMARPCGDVDFPDRVEFNEHLSGCTACQRAVQSIAKWDRQLRRSMNDVLIPEGLSRRMIDSLQRDCISVPVATKSHPSPSGKERHWRRHFAAVSVVCLLGMAAWGTRQLFHPPMLSSANMSQLLQSSSEDLPAFRSAGNMFPRHWSALRREIIVDDWKRAELQSLRVTVAVSRFRSQSRHGPPVEGVLFAIPISRWTPTPATTISQASIQYSPPNVWVVWTEREFVYILSLNGPAQSLEQIQHQLDGNHAVL